MVFAHPQKLAMTSYQTMLCAYIVNTSKNNAQKYYAQKTMKKKQSTVMHVMIIQNQPKYLYNTSNKITIPTIEVI